MQEAELTLKVIERVSSMFAPLVGAAFILLAIIIGLILLFVKKQIEAMVENTSKKSLAEFQKGIELLFRDEVLRNSLRTHLGQLSINRQLELYDNVYALYFDYQKSWYFTTATPKEDINKLWTKILDLRHKLFLNAIYLGPLMDFLMPAVINMMDGLSSKEIRAERTTSNTRTEITITDNLDKASKWITQNLVSHQAISMYELKEDALHAIAEQRQKLIDEQIIH